MSTEDAAVSRSTGAADTLARAKAAKTSEDLFLKVSLRHFLAHQQASLRAMVQLIGRLKSQNQLQSSLGLPMLLPVFTLCVLRNRAGHTEACPPGALWMFAKVSE